MRSLSSHEVLGRNGLLKNRHEGRRCFIICNGPSLSRQDLTPLVNEVTFVVNAFWKHPLVETLKPNYYLLADPALFDGSEPFLNSGFSMTTDQYFRTLSAKALTSEFIVPLLGCQAIMEKDYLPLKRTYYFNSQGLVGFGEMKFPDFTQLIPGVQNVSQLALMAAMYMGCSPIYLLGLDHDWFATWGATNDFNGKSAMLPRTYRCELERQLRLWRGYEQLLRIANVYGIRVLNATRGGYLDVFERIDYEAVCGEALPPDPASSVIGEAAFKSICAKLKFDTEMHRYAAIQTIQQAINCYPDSQILYVFEAGMRYQCGDFQGAIENLAAFDLRWPDNAEIHNALGVTQWLSKDIQGAASSFLRAIEVDSRHRNAVLNYGQLLIQSGRTAEANRLYSDFLAINPKDDKVRHALMRSGTGQQLKDRINLAIALPFFTGT
jgi:tetratricopeptide (TPR) repeat protein